MVSGMLEEKVIPESDITKLEFSQKLWPDLPAYYFRPDQYADFFRDVVRQLGALGKEAYSASTIEELLKLVDRLRGGAGQSEVIEISRSLELAATIWLPASIDSTEEPGLGYLQWPRNKTLAQCMEDFFAGDPIEPPRGKQSRVPSSFSLPYLCSRYQFSIKWTDNLARHLEIDWRNDEIIVYEHLISLRNHLRYSTHCPIPKGILEEAIDTINLLFPQTREVRRFLERRGISFAALGPCGRKRQLDLAAYRFWHGNIVELVEILGERPPGWRQLWLDRDRRNFLAWATFWMALLVAVLTVVSIVFGVVSTVYGVKSYQLGVDSYSLGVESLEMAIAQLELAVAELCGNEEIAAKVPDHCAILQKKHEGLS